MDPTSTQVATDSPISQLIPYVTASFSALKVAFRLTTRALRPVQNLSPLPIVIYILAPALVLLDITTTLFLRTPYRTAVYLLEAVYPLYVFVGVACITGGILGLAARVLSRVIIVSLQYPTPDASLEQAPQPAVKNEADAEVADLRRKGKRAEKSKFGS